MNLVEFKEKLQELIPTNQRPFICDGSPFDCKIFIVGINPATQTDPIWEFWNDKSGLDFKGWFDNYKQCRLNKNQRAISPSRRNINLISDYLRENNMLVLETNIYNVSTKREKEIESQYKKSTAFEFLFKTVQPKVLLVHGKTPQKVILKMLNTDYSDSESNYELFGMPVRLFFTQHMSYQYSKERAIETANAIMKLIKT